MSQFDYPVPGQSLTSPPKNMSYENPYEIVDPKKALEKHFGNLSRKEAIEDIIFFSQSGMDVKSLTEGILRSAVAEGVHSIDVSIIIAPLVHEFIVGRLDATGMEYDEGLENLNEKNNIRFQRLRVLAENELNKIKDEDSEILNDTLMDDEMMQNMQEDVASEARVEEEKEPVKGLMSRS
tara:strand:- start:98 stop:637 length:540 start_codon:yes stop_codon:yes gene_type:complete